MAKMDLIAHRDNRRVWLTQIQQSDAFVSPCPNEEFAAMIVVNDPRVSNDNRNIIADSLIHQGCRYGVCFGHDCSGWDDALDWAFMATDHDCTPPDERFVMTSWHEDEPLKDTVFTFINLTTFDTFQPDNFVVVLIGGGSSQEVIAVVQAEIATDYPELTSALRPSATFS